MLLRAGGATLLIMCLTATAVAVAVIREVQDITAPIREGRATIEIPELDRADAGGARTFMILGSDKRDGVDADSPPRSDTILLIRADPDKDSVGVMSIPRDLAVEIPGHGKDKVNAAYDYGGRKGGARLVLRTVKKLFEDATGEHFPITNVMVMDYGAFRRAVDYVKGVYVDIDRRYFNDNSSGENYATIDIQPGYQKLLGQDALDFVRYRHEDSDLVRAARQQDFLRQAQNASGVRRLMSLGESRHLVRVFSRYFEVDRSLRSTKEIFSLLRLVLFLAENEPKVNEVRFRVYDAENPQVDSRLYAKKGWLRQMHREFMSTAGLGDAAQGGHAADPRRPRVREGAQEAQQEARGPGRRARGDRRGRVDGRAGRPRARLPVLLPDGARDRVGVLGHRAAHLPPQGRARQAPRRLPARAARPRDRRVLRRPGHDLARPADPRQPGRDGHPQEAQVPALLRRQPPAAGRVEDPARRVLGLEHPHAVDRRGPDAGDRILARTTQSVGWTAHMSSSEREPIGVIGTGYVGLVTAAGFAELGNEVWCIDIDAEKIRGLQEGRIPIWEPGLEELVARHRDRMHFSTDLADALDHARLLFVAVGTPPTYSGDADLSAVHAVVGAMPPSDRHALVMKSTVPVGTGDNIKRVFAEQGKGGFRYVSCPEFLKEGSAVKDFLEPDRVVVGDDGDWAGDAVVALYEPLGAPLVRTDIRSAEMVKLASNAFLATKISFINEIANVCEETGADVVEVARGMGLDDRIGPKFLQAGIGFGGSCFPKDVTALKQLAGNSGYHFQLLNSVIEVNELQKRRVIAKLQKHLGSLVGKEIGLLGLAFKPNTDDMREASSLVLSARLQAAGARVRAYDPVAEDEARKLIRGVDFKPSAAEVVDGADAVVLVTEWPEFGELDFDAVASDDARDAGRRRAQLPRPGRGHRGGPEVRGSRAHGTGERRRLRRCRR